MGFSYYYVNEANEQAGPLEVPQLAELYRSGKIADDTLVWHDAMANWAEIGAEPELKAQLVPKKPPPPPVPSRPPPPPPARPAAALAPAPAPAPAPKPAFATPAPAAKAVARRWREKKTLDGTPWYHDEATGEVSWDRPAELSGADPAQRDDGNWVWVFDERHGYLPAQKVGGKLRLEDGSAREQPEGTTLFPLTRASLLRPEQDLVMLDAMDEGLICHTLRKRLEADAFYTAVGTILVAINPFKYHPELYTSTLMHDYHQPGNRTLPPHVFNIAAAAHRSLSLEAKTQALLISGESGAGKTEATKHCLAFLAEVAGSASAVEGQLLQANPLLEAFGNAKTVRNNNSSRFGKWVEVQ